MYFFILLSLALGCLVETKSPLLRYLLSDTALYFGLACITGAVISSLFKRLSAKVWYDWFACGTLLVWLPYWYPNFREGSPVFFYFPLYFALISALFSLVFIKPRRQVDEQTLAFLQWLSDSGRFNPAVIVVFVCVGLYLTQHFLLYPVAMTLLVMRYALARCLLE